MSGTADVSTIPEGRDGSGHRATGIRVAKSAGQWSDSRGHSCLPVILNHRRVFAKGKAEPKRAPLSRLTPDADLSLVRLHRKPAKGKTKAGRMLMFMAAICLTKFFEDMLVLVLRNSFAIVTDGDNCSRNIALNVYADDSISSCKLQRIADQVL